MKQQPVKAGGIEKLDHFDKKFVTNLDTLFERTKLVNRTAFAKFLGVSYVTYCNWRSGRYQKTNDFPTNSIDAYCRLSDKELRALVVERIAE